MSYKTIIAFVVALWWNIRIQNLIALIVAHSSQYHKLGLVRFKVSIL